MSYISGTLADKFSAGPVWGVEVGVHRGENAAEMLAECPGMVLVMVDHWRFRGEPIDEQYAKASKIRHGGIDNYRAALNATDEYRHRRVVVPLDSVTASALFVDEFFDIVFLDGDHRLDAVRLDLAAWWPKVRPGGLMAGHDLNAQRPGWGVRQAVEELDRPFEERAGCFLMWKT